jgi:hypothetical protein
MSALTPQPSSTSTPADLAPVVAQVSMTFGRLFGPRWREQGSDPKTLATWERTFALARLGPDDIRRGLAAAAMLEWPPSCGEFVSLCRAPVPSIEAALAEAARWSHQVEQHNGEWSHPAIGAAARKVGDHALRTLDAQTQRRRFEPEYRAAVAAHWRGEPLELPLRRLAHDPKPGPQTPEQVQRSLSIIDEIRRGFGGDCAA